jgi:hypothetical protein
LISLGPLFPTHGHSKIHAMLKLPSRGMEKEFKSTEIDKIINTTKEKIRI